MSRNLLKVLLLSPIFYWIYLILFDQLGVEPAKSLNHKMGEMGMYYILFNLILGGWIDLRWKIKEFFRPFFLIRRYLGVLSYVFLLGHVFMYFVLESFEFQAIEQIYTKTYLIFGFSAFLILTVLAITSNNFFQKKLGPKVWKRVHRLVYLASIFIYIHVISIEKTDLVKYGIIMVLLVLFQLIRWIKVYERHTQQNS